MRLRPALPTPAELMARFGNKMGELRASLSNDVVRPDVAAIPATPIESVTIYLVGKIRHEGKWC